MKKFLVFGFLAVVMALGAIAYAGEGDPMPVCQPNKCTSAKKAEFRLSNFINSIEGKPEASCPVHYLPNDPKCDSRMPSPHAPH